MATKKQAAARAKFTRTPCCCDPAPGLTGYRDPGYTSLFDPVPGSLADHRRNPLKHCPGSHEVNSFGNALLLASASFHARLLASRFPAGMPTDHVVRIVTAVASALDYAHKRGLLPPSESAAPANAASWGCGPATAAKAPSSGCRCSPKSRT